MDLSLQTGWTLPFIATMKESELSLWHRYAMQKGFPLRRLEYGLARICTMIAAACGAPHPELRDYLFDPPEDESAEITDEELAELKAAIGFNPQ